MIEIRPDRKYYVPVMNGERQFYLASKKSRENAIIKAQYSEGVKWAKLEKQGWTIEEFWGSEYE